MKRITSAFLIYLAFCSFMAFVDADWDAEDDRTAQASLGRQILYMNNSQRQAYFDDLSVIDAAGLMGGGNGKMLHGKEADDIHDLANKIREKRGRQPVKFPSKPYGEAVSTFFKIPFLLLIDKR